MLACLVGAGATIMKTLDIVHPAAKTLVDISLAQDAEVDAGRRWVVLAAGAGRAACCAVLGLNAAECLWAVLGAGRCCMPAPGCLPLQRACAMACM